MMNLDAHRTLPNMGKWQETVGTGFGTGRNKGTTKRESVTDERDGTEAGYHLEHWDDRVDAVATPKTTKMNIGVHHDKEEG